jgi:penicillin-binding protein 1A
VGWTPKYTVAVWVGYPNEFKSMETEFAGQPVAGGTYPASIFHSFIATDLANNPPKPEETPTPTAPVPGATTAPAPTATAPPTDTAPEPTPAPTEAPAPEPTTAPPATTPDPGGDQAPAPED